MGWSYGNVLDPQEQHSGALKLEVRKGKLKPQEYHRWGRMLTELHSITNEAIKRYGIGSALKENPAKVLKIVYEDARELYSPGKSARNINAGVVAVLMAFCSSNGLESPTAILPLDLKRFATGKTKADKEEMIWAAQRMGYKGKQDDEADAYLIYHWAVQNLHWPV